MPNGNSKLLLTHSSITAFKACPKKFYWRYVCEVEAKVRPEALLLGQAIHEFLEAHYRQIPYTPPDNLTPKSLAILRGVMEGYPVMYLDDCDLFEPLALEKVIRGEIINIETGRSARDFSFSGKIDGLIVLKKDVEGFKAGDLLLLEHKSASRIDEAYFERLQLDSQLRLYALFLSRELGTPIAGTLFNVLVKPGLRQKKNESEAAYHQRLRLEMDWPEQYNRRYLRLSDYRLQEIQRELWDMKNLISQAQREGVYTMNTASCHDYHRLCDYWPLCTSQDPDAVIQESGQFQHQQAHCELVETNGRIVAEAAAEAF